MSGNIEMTMFLDEIGIRIQVNSSLYPTFTYILAESLIPPFRGDGQKHPSEVMDRIEKREIWIPSGEVKRYYLSKIGKWFRKIESEWESQTLHDNRQQELEKR